MKQYSPTMKTILTVAALVLAALSAFGQQQVAIDRIVPTLDQLGPSWTSNRVAILVDPLSSPSLVTNVNEGPGWLKIAQNAVGKDGRKAYAVLRYCQVSNSVLVWINRFKSKGDIPLDWGGDKDTEVTQGKLPNVGEEVRFYRRHGMHNDIAFRRGTCLITVEGMAVPIEKLKQLAAVLDENLLRATSKQP